jgi:deoxyribodipyrimidine photo-lyase
LQQLLHETSSDTIYTEEDFTPYDRKRDEEIEGYLPLQRVQAQTVHHPLDILKKDGKPYTVFSPYAKAWKARLASSIKLYPIPENIPTPVDIKSDPLPGFKVSPLFPAGEQEALVRLEEFLHQRIYSYSKDRDCLDLNGTSSLSPYVHFGMLGLRQAVHAAQQAMVEARNEISKRSAETWLNELIWREFYIQILFHFPYVSERAFNPSLTNIAWRNDESEFEAWQEGQTGVPIVDAAMRQLKEIGWMHNRARMIAASYLVKDLLIDWRWGEQYFMEELLDGDQAANNGGWQWIAGTGTDAAPYFRIFNPVLQSTKFDPHGEYIRRWVPELRHVDAKEIHAPWEKGIKVKGYPERPIIERDTERTKMAYQSNDRLEKV